MVCLLIMVSSATAQQQRLDSLITANNNYVKEDSTKVLLLIELMKECRKLKLTAQRFVYANAATDLGEKIKFTRLLPPIYNTKGLYYEGISDFERSIANYTRAIELAELVGDKHSAADYSLNYGTVYHTLADYPRALSLYQKSANYYISTGNEEDAANSFVNMGSIYMEYPDQNEKAIDFFGKALKSFQKMGDDGKRGVAECYQSMSSAYLASSDAELLRLKVDPANKYIIGREYLDKALAIAIQTKDNDLEAEVRTHLGNLNEKRNNHAAAIQEYQFALNVYQKSEKKTYAATAMLNIGRAYTRQNEFTKGMPYLQMGLAGGRQFKVLDLQKDALLAISNMHEKQGHFDSAYTYYRDFIVMRDSIFNNEKQKDITRKQFQFEFNQKEREYQLNQQIADNKIKQQVALAIQQKQQLSIRNKELELTNREKEIQKLNYLKKQSELEAEQKLKNSLLSQKDLEKKLETSIRDEKISEQQLQIKFNRNLTLFMGLMLVLLTGAGFFVYRAKQRTARLNTLVSAQKEELEEMSKVKDKIFSIVSHDMRAPVNNLIAFSALLEDGEIEQERLALYIEQVKGTLDHTSSMMENLLKWAASQMQGFTPLQESVDISDVTYAVLSGFTDALQKKNIYIHNQLENNLFVKGDKNMIELIVRNLISNAVKFTANKGQIQLYHTLQPDGSLAICVKDNGVGLSEAKVNKINAPSSVTLESTAGTQKEKGTGIGLLLCKHFATLMNGRIAVSSQQGAGSEFRLLLPVVSSS